MVGTCGYRALEMGLVGNEIASSVKYILGFKDNAQKNKGKRSY